MEKIFPFNMPSIISRSSLLLWVFSLYPSTLSQTRSTKKQNQKQALPTQDQFPESKIMSEEEEYINSILEAQPRCGICTDDFPPLDQIIKASNKTNTQASVQDSAQDSTKPKLCPSPVLLPCGHLFGTICLNHWFAIGSQHNCPICRRSLIYKSCQHLILPCGILTAPSSVAQEDMPKTCFWDCEGNREMKELKERMEEVEKEKKAVAGMGTYLPGQFRGMSMQTVDSARERVEGYERELKGLEGEEEVLVKRLGEEAMVKGWGDRW